MKQNEITVELLFDVYLCAMKLTHTITDEQLRSHMINSGVCTMALMDLEETPKDMVVYPRLPNSRRAIELLQSFIFESDATHIARFKNNITLGNDEVVFRSDIAEAEHYEQ